MIVVNYAKQENKLNLNGCLLYFDCFLVFNLLNYIFSKSQFIIAGKKNPHMFFVKCEYENQPLNAILCQNCISDFGIVQYSFA